MRALAPTYSTGRGNAAGWPGDYAVDGNGQQDSGERMAAGEAQSQLSTKRDTREDHPLPNQRRRRRTTRAPGRTGVCKYVVTSCLRLRLILIHGPLWATDVGSSLSVARTREPRCVALAQARGGPVLKAVDRDDDRPYIVHPR